VQELFFLEIKKLLEVATFSGLGYDAQRKKIEFVFPAYFYGGLILAIDQCPYLLELHGTATSKTAKHHAFCKSS